MEHVLTMANLKLKPFLFTPRPSAHFKASVQGYGRPLYHVKHALDLGTSRQGQRAWMASF